MDYYLDRIIKSNEVSKKLILTSVGFSFFPKLLPKDLVLP